MRITAISGSPSSPSRSDALLNHVAERLASRGAQIERLAIQTLAIDDLVLARFDSEAVRQVRAAVAGADALLVSTPVYKASFASGLKAILDILPEQALVDKVVLPLATAGSPGHVLALDYALKPVLSALGTRYVLQGVYATDRQSIKLDDGNYRFDDDIVARLDDAAERLSAAVRETQLTRQRHDTTPIALAAIAH